MSIFDNCSRHYANELYFENCTLTTAPCQLIEDLNTFLYFTNIVFYVCTASFSVAALANFYCLCVTVPVFFRMKEESRKRYIFLVTRCISAILVAVSMLLTTWLFSDTFHSNHSAYFLYAIVLIVNDTNTYGLLGSYAGLALLLYIGVIYPMFFNSAITVRFIYALVFLIYTSAFVFSVPFALFQAAIIDPGIIYCDLKTCAPIILTIEFVVTCMCLVFTIAVLFFVLVSLFRHSYRLKRADTFSSSASSMNRMRSRLAGTLIVVIFISSAQCISFSFLLKLSFLPDSNGICANFYHANKLVEECIAGFVEFMIWSLVMIFDPLANIYCDKKIAGRVKEQSLITRHFLPMPEEDLFANCSVHYPIERYFVNCTNTTRPCELIHDFEIVTKLLDALDYYTSSVLFTLALIVNVHFLTIALPLFIRIGDEARKRYVFLLSRCVSSISAAASLLIVRCVLYVYLPPGTSCSCFYLYAVFIIADSISFYSLQGAYIGMAVLLYIGVIHPAYFSVRLTLRKIYILAVFNWILAAAISVPLGFFQAATYVDGPISCDSQVCSPLITLINYVIISLAFLITIAILLFVLICLSRHIRQSKKLGSYTSSQTIHHARVCLLWTLLAIVLICLAEGIPASFELGLKADNVLGTCTNFYQADHLISVTIFTSLDSIIWAIVLLIDPITNIIFDKQISCELMNQVNRTKVYFAKILENLFHPSRSLSHL